MQVKCRVFQSTKLLPILIDLHGKTCIKCYRMKFKEQDRPKVYTVTKCSCNVAVSYIAYLARDGQFNAT